ncbi:autotransporter-associated beta strand repeat-containing protein [Paraburkholderia hayleyella]|uniref:autotransporter-associated beta strand repeat-containing protein n=1 Tax=Paraburkholderia hayleyella TaxID=2152889 RepID=UPI001291904B|nr:autotransporter-associated beta strand repeat-containing protein [Paraburkholderia hayleyella]
MSKVYRVVWSGVHNAFVVASELVKGRGRGHSEQRAQRRERGAASGVRGAQPGAGGTGRLDGLARASLLRSLGWVFFTVVFYASGSPVAWAACVTAGASVTCSGSTNVFSSGTNGLIVSVLPSATVGISAGLGGTPMSLTGANIQFSNQGTVSAALSGSATSPTTAVVLGTTSLLGLNVVSNLAGATISGSNSTTYNPTTGSLSSLGGLALDLRNSANGTTTISNAGTLNLVALTGAPGKLASEAPVVAVQGGGKVIMTNEATGVITGRVAFDKSSAGNTFFNAGTINGSVSLGAGGANTFTAITGSVISAGGSTASVPLTGLASNPALTFAAPGVVDGGAGGNNTLELSNNGDAAGSLSGSGNVSTNTYRNFSHLTLTSGTWTLSGATAFMDTALNNGALVIAGGAGALPGTITANGGELQSGEPGGVDVSGNVILGAGGLTVRGNFPLTLSGVVSGSGRLMNGAGQLILTNSNTYSGTTSLYSAMLRVGSDTALGTSTVEVQGNSRLSSTQGVTLNNPITLWNAPDTLEVLANDLAPLTLNGTITGNGRLAKSGSGTLTLNQTNLYRGTTELKNGTLLLGRSGTMGFGELIVSGPSSLGARDGLPLELNTPIYLQNTLTALSSSPLTLSGYISGTGGLIKSGSDTLTLNGANSFFGAVSIGSGKLVVGSDTALGIGNLQVSGNAMLDNNRNVSLSNRIVLNGSLELPGVNDLRLNGPIVAGGSSHLSKTGSGTLTLNGDNNYSSGTSWSNGKIVVGSSTAFGAGAVQMFGTTLTLDSSTAVSLGNHFVMNPGASLNLGGSNALGLSGVISGDGGLTKNGASSVTLSGTNIYTGYTTINAGTLALSSSGSLANSRQVNLAGETAVFSIADSLIGQTVQALNGVSGSQVLLGSRVLTLDGSTINTFSGVVSGEGGSLIKQGSGIQNLNGANTYTGGTTINEGTLALGSQGSLAATGLVNTAASGTVFNLASAGNQTIGGLLGVAGSSVILGGNTLTLGDGLDRTFAGEMSGTGGIVKQGGGTQTLNGANTYTGTTTINGGTLALGATGSLAGNNTVVLSGPNATFSIASVAASGGSRTIGGLDGVGGAWVELGGNTLTLGDTTAGGSTHDFGGTINGTGGIVKQGTGTQTLSGANTYTGETTINAGTLSLKDDGRLAMGAVVNVAGNGATFDISASSGKQIVSVLKGGAGSAVTLGDNTLQLGDATQQDFAGTISGSGGIDKSGAGQQRLTGVNTYTGDTTIYNGTLTLSASGRLAQNSTVVLSGPNAVFDIGDNGAGANQTIGGMSAMAAGSRVVLGGNTLTFGDANDHPLGSVISGTGGIVKQGAGKDTVYAANTFTGEVRVNEGTLALNWTGSLASASRVNVGAGATFDISETYGANLTALAGASGSTVALGGQTLTFGDASAQTFSGVITGSGGIIKQGSGTQTLEGANTYTGGTTVNVGTLALGANGSLAATGGLRLANDQTVFDISAAHANQTIGDLVTAVGSTVVLGANTLTFGAASGGYVEGAISGTGGIVKQGISPTYLFGANTYTGGTTINEGELNVMGSGSLAAGSAVNLTGANAALVFNSGVNPVLGSLNSSVASSTVSLGLTTLTLGDNDDHSFAGMLYGSGGLVKTGSGTQTLGISTNYSGSTTINDGTLAVGSGGSFQGEGEVNLTGQNAKFDVTNGSTLQNVGALNGVAGSQVVLGANNLVLGLGNAGDATFAGVIRGSGGLVKQGANTQTLTGANTYTGTTDISQGTLALAADGSLDRTAVRLGDLGGFDISASNGDQSIGGLSSIGVGGTVALGERTLTLNLLADQVFNGTISGNGGVIKEGRYSQTFDGYNTYTGDTLIRQGSLVLGQFGRLSSSGKVWVGTGATLDLSAGGYQSVGALTGETGSTVILGADALTLGDDDDHTYDGNIAGAGSIYKIGSGRETLTGNHSYTGGTTINAGTLALSGEGSLTATGMVNLAMAGAAFDIADSRGGQTIGQLEGVADSQIVLGANTLSFGREYDGFYSGVISGTGSIVKQGSGTQTLDGANTYTGKTTINNGTLALGMTGSLAANNTVDVAATGATFSIAYSGGGRTIGGLDGVGGAQVKLGDNTLTLGDTTAGGSAHDFGGTISGSGGIVKQGAGTQTLSGANTYTGETTINEGTLSLAGGGSLGSGAVVNVAGNGATFDISASSGNQTVGVLKGGAGSAVTLGGNTLTLGDASNQSFDGAISGTGGITKQGGGTQTLNGANTYTGDTTINEGTLTLGANGSLSGQSTVNLAGGGAVFDIDNYGAGANQTIGGLSGTAGSRVVLGGNTLTFGDGYDHNFAGSIEGTGGIIKQGAGKETFTGVSTFTGNTLIKDGTLVVGVGGRLSANSTVVVGSGAVLDLAAGGLQTIGSLVGEEGSTIALGANQLTLGGTGDETFNGGMAGTGSIVKEGNDKQMLNGTNTYTGSTTINGGTLALGENGSLTGGGAVILANQQTIFDISASKTNQSIGALSGVAGSKVALGAKTLSFGDATAQRFDGVIEGSGGIVKQGAGTVTLSDASTYTGGTTIKEGTLALTGNGALAQNGAMNLAGDGTRFDMSGGANQTLGSLAGSATSKVALGSNTLTLSDGGNQTFAGVIGGSGALVKDGGGTQTLSGANTYSGGTVINNGTLALGAGGSLAATGAVNLAQANAKFDLAAASGPQTIGALSGVGHSTIALGGNTLAFGDASDQHFDGVISGSGGIVKQGSGVQTLSGANTYTGGTTVRNGTLALGAGASLGGAGALNLEQTGTKVDLSGSGRSQRIGGLSGAGGSLLELGGSTLALGDSANTEFAGAISGSGGLVKEGSGTQTLSGVNTYSGGTTVNAGTLALKGGGRLAAGSALNLAAAGAGFDLAAGGSSTLGALAGARGSTIALGNNTLTFGDSTNQTFGGSISGSGGLVKQGSGTQTLDGANTYSGEATINGGTLALGANGRLAADSTVNLAQAATVFDLSGSQSSQTLAQLKGVAGTSVALGANTLTFGDSSDQQFGGSISGSGGLVKQGSGTQTLKGANTFTGDLSVSAGALVLGQDASLASIGALSLGQAATLDVASGRIGRVRSLAGAAGSALALGANALSFGDASDQRFDGAISGSAGVTKEGSGTTVFGGVNSYSGATTVNAGTLVIDGTAARSAVTVNDGATLGGGGTVGALTVKTGGTAAPGAPAATLKVAGDVSFAPDSVYQVAASAQQAGNRIDATGTASLAGARCTCWRRAATTVRTASTRF